MRCFVSRRPPRTRHGQMARSRSTSRICKCSECGQVVWPFPLPLSPAMRLVRGYPRVRAGQDRRARVVRFDPLLWCDACAPPLVVQWWIRWERMAAELLLTLPSIPDDVEASDEADADEAALSTNDVSGVGVDAEAAVYSPVVLP